MNLKLFTAKLVAASCSLMVFTACSDVVVKVQKKPKNVDTSTLQNLDSLNLGDSQDFLKQLDSLKTVGIDILVRQFQERDFRSQVRNAIRKYRSFLIERGTGKVSINDSFYSSADECRQASLNLNMDDANEMLGMILKTAVLSKLSELSADKLDNLNPGMAKMPAEMQLLGKIILEEFGLRIEAPKGMEKRLEISKDGDKTVTKAAMVIGLKEIAGEEIDEATKAADKVEDITIIFTRALGADYVGTFDATLKVGHKKADNSDEVLVANMGIERSVAVASSTNGSKFLHTLDFKLGVDGGATNYARKMIFEQVDGNKIKVTDVINAGKDDAKTYSSVIDIKAKTQCKTGDESLDPPSDGGSKDDDSKDDDTVTDPGTGTGTGSGTGTGTVTDPGTGTGTGTVVKDDDSDKPGKGDDTNTPTQNPGQNRPTQNNPGQK